MNREIKLFVSDVVQPPHALRFTDKFIVKDKAPTVFHHYKSALVIPGADPDRGALVVASNGEVIFGARTVFDSLDSLMRPREFYYLKGSYFCVINWCYSEYYHFTKNSLQSILVALNEGFDLRENRIVIFENSPDYVYSYLRLLKECGYAVDWVEIPSEKITQCEEMIFAFPLNSFTSEIAAIFQDFKSRVLKLYPIRSILPKKVYISRSDAKHKRPVVNEIDVMQELTRFGFMAFGLAELSVLEKIQLFSQADHVIFSHGAGGVHTVYISEGVRVIEVFNDDDVLDFFSAMVGSLRSFYFGIVCKRHERGGTVVDLPLLKQVLLKGQNMLYDVPTHEFRYEEHLEEASLNAAESVRRAIALLRQSSVQGEFHYLVRMQILDEVVPFLSEKMNFTYETDIQAGMCFSAYLRLGDLFRKNRDYENAIRFYKKCLALPLRANVPVLEKLVQCELSKCNETIQEYLEGYASKIPASSYQRLVNQYLNTYIQGGGI